MGELQTVIGTANTTLSGLTVKDSAVLPAGIDALLPLKISNTSSTDTSVYGNVQTALDTINKALDDTNKAYTTLSGAITAGQSGVTSQVTNYDTYCDKIAGYPKGTFHPVVNLSGHTIDPVTGSYIGLAGDAANDYYKTDCAKNAQNYVWNGGRGDSANATLQRACVQPILVVQIQTVLQRLGATQQPVVSIDQLMM